MVGLWVEQMNGKVLCPSIGVSIKEMKILNSSSFSFIYIHTYTDICRISVITPEGDAVWRVCGWNKWKGNFYMQVLMLVLRK